VIGAARFFAECANIERWNSSRYEDSHGAAERPARFRVLGADGLVAARPAPPPETQMRPIVLD